MYAKTDKIPRQPLTPPYLIALLASLHSANQRGTHPNVESQPRTILLHSSLPSPSRWTRTGRTLSLLLDEYLQHEIAQQRKYAKDNSEERDVGPPERLRVEAK